MTIFELAFYSCISYGSINGMTVQGLDVDKTTTCAWGNPAGLYRQVEKCEGVGRNALGTPIFGDIADGRTRDKFRCAPRNVEE